MNMNDIETITFGFTIIANEVSNAKYLSLNDTNWILGKKIQCCWTISNVVVKPPHGFCATKRRSSLGPFTFDKWSLVVQENILRLIIMVKPYGKILLGPNGHPYGTFFMIKHLERENNWCPFYYIYLQNLVPPFSNMQSLFL